MSPWIPARDIPFYGHPKTPVKRWPGGCSSAALPNPPNFRRWLRQMSASYPATCNCVCDITCSPVIPVVARKGSSQTTCMLFLPLHFPYRCDDRARGMREFSSVNEYRLRRVAFTTCRSVCFRFRGSGEPRSFEIVRDIPVTSVRSARFCVLHTLELRYRRECRDHVSDQVRQSTHSVCSENFN